MLKPKRTILSKEIKRDPFLESIVSIKTHITEKKQIYIRIALSATILLVLGSIFIRNQEENRDIAEGLLSKAMIYIDLNDEENATIHLQELIDEFESTESGKNASFYLGRIYLNKNDFNLALPYFERYIGKGNNPLLIGAAYQAMVNIYLSQLDLKNAIYHQKMSIEYSNSKEERAWASLRLANLSLAIGDKSSALKLVNRVLDEFTENAALTQRANEINGKIGHIGES